MRPKTVLDRVRPTVVRRRPGEPVAPGRDDDAEAGPPSSINVARALASLRADELRRVETIVGLDDPGPESVVFRPEAQAAPPPPAPPPSSKTVRVGREIVLGDLAARMGVPREELVTILVTNGFFSVTAKTAISREAARIGAAAFGWDVEAVDDDPLARTAQSPIAPGAIAASRRAPKAKKAASKSKSKSTAKAKASVKKQAAARAKKR